MTKTNLKTDLNNSEGFKGGCFLNLIITKIDHH